MASKRPQAKRPFKKASCLIKMQRQRQRGVTPEGVSCLGMTEGYRLGVTTEGSLIQNMEKNRGAAQPLYGEVFISK